MSRTSRTLLVVAALVVGSWPLANTHTFAQSPGSSAVQETDATDDKVAKKQLVKVAQGKIEFSVPGVWKKVQPKINMIEAEFSIPQVDGDPKPGRLTIMGAGGSVQQNIDRWIGQFKQPDEDKTKVEKKTVSGQTVHMVDITGNYLDSAGGPFGPKTERENYRMLGAIIETESAGNYFFKLYGPKKTLGKHYAGFKSMVESIKIGE